jgi:DNA-binding NarL/FixJ family response regulator
MKKINVTVVCVGDESYPGCVDLLTACPGINIVARKTGLDEAGTWVALGRSDVLLLDEAVLEQDGHQAIRAIHDSYSSLKSLLIIENETEQEMVTVLSLGIQGVIRRGSATSFLCKAIAAICAGEAWLSRGMAQPLYRKLGRDTGLHSLLEELPDPQGGSKLH